MMMFHAGGTTVTVTFDNLTIALLVASILYTFCLIMAKRKLDSLHQIRPQLSTKKLLLMSVAVVCAVRIMTILGVAGMNIANVRAHYSLQPINSNHHHDEHNEHEHEHDNDDAVDQNQAFYDKAMTVLFDLPNCVVVSTYVLLTLVWAECFLESRFHTESIIQWKKTWLKLYMAFNALLYGCQLLLYSSIFIATDSIVRTVLYAGITFINFVAVIVVLTLYSYLNIRFAGFPYTSPQASQSMHKISVVIQLWSVTRLVWGIATLLVFIYNIELLQDSNTPIWSFVVLLLLFLVCEVLPMIAMLDYSYMNIMIGILANNHNNHNESHAAGTNNNEPWLVGDHILTLPLLLPDAAAATNQPDNELPATEASVQ